MRSSVVALAQTASTLRRGFVPGVKAAVQVLGQDGALALPRLRSTLMDVARGFASADNTVTGMAGQARSWQGSGAYPGIDHYTNLTLPPGTTLEAGFPGLSSYAAPGGNAAAHGHSAREVWEGLQVGPSAQHGYRPSVVEIQVNNPVDAATGTTLANPQYGQGGTQQYFLDITDGLSTGDLSVLDHAGNPIDLTGVAPADINAAVNRALGSQGTIPLHGGPSPDVFYQDTIKAHPDRYPLPDLGQQHIDDALRESLGSVTRTLQGTGYYGGSR